MTIAELIAKVGIEASQFDSGLDNSSRRIDDFGNKVDEGGKKVQSFGQKLDTVGSLAGSWGAKLSLGVTAPVLGATGAMIKLASDASESLGKVGVVFGQNASQVVAWSQTSAKAMGLSRQEAQETASTYGNLFVSMDISSEKAAKMSTSLTQLGADLASLNNSSVKDATEALRSGLVGETEPLRRFGVNLNDAAIRQKALELGLIKTTKDALEPQTKALAVYSLAFDQTKTAQGDYKRTADGLANSTRTFGAEIKDTAEKLGKEFLPIAKDGLHTLQGWLEAFNKLPDWVKKFGVEVALAAAALGPLLTTLSAILGVIKDIQIIRGLMAVGNTAAAVATAAGASATAAAASTAIVPALGAGATAAAVPAGAVAFGAGSALVALAGGVAGGYGLSYAYDKHKGVADPGIGGTLYGMGLNPWWNPDEMSGGSKGLTKEEFQAQRAQGQSPAQLARQTREQAAKEKSAGDTEELQKATNAYFNAQIKQAEVLAAGAAEGKRAQSAAKLVVPQLKAEAEDMVRRANDLVAGGLATYKEQKELQKVRQDYFSIMGDIQSLEQAATKEIADNTKEQARKAKEVAEMAKRAQESAMEVARNEATIRANQVVASEGDDVRAQATAEQMIPVLQAQQRIYVSQVQSAKNTDEYWELRKKFTDAAQEIGNLELAAVREVEKNEKAALQREVEIAKARDAAEAQRVQAIGAMAGEGNDARAELNAALPYLQRKLMSLVEEANDVTREEDDRAKIIQEYWSTQRQIADLQSAANKEQISETKKAADAAKKTSRDAHELVNAQVELRQAQLKNVVGATSEQQKRMLIPALLEQLRSQLSPVEGETEIERVKRLTGAEGIKTEMLEAIGASGKGAFRKVRGFGQVPNFNPREVMELDSLVRQVENESAGATRRGRSVSRGNTPPAVPNGAVTLQIFIQPGSPAEMQAQLGNVLNQLVNQYFGGGPMMQAGQ